jgi:CRISPR-associated protein Cas1
LRIIEIGGDNYFLHVKNDCFTAEKDNAVVSTAHFSDIHSIVCHSLQCTYSDALFKKCMEYNIPFIICDDKHVPSGMMLPFLQHTDSSGRLSTQINAKLPLKKQIWKQVISEKLLNQANHLLVYGYKKQAEHILILSKTVKSGDADFHEAQGAKIYFSVLFGKDFRRNRENNINGCLDYGYTILRSSVARAISGCGLLPCFGIFHSNMQNSFCLVDDLMEPLRPLVDMYVQKIYAQNRCFELNPQIKKKLISIISHTVNFGEEKQELSFALQNYVHSYFNVLEGRQKQISFPKFDYDFAI